VSCYTGDPHPIRKRWDARPPENQEHLCSVEGIAACIGADMFIGTELDQEAIEALSAYHVVLVDLHAALAKAVLELTRVHDFVAVFQEGPGCIWNTLPLGDRERYIKALRAARLVLVQNPELIGTWKFFTKRPIGYLLFPFPRDAELHRRTPDDRRNWIFVGASPTAHRGGLLSLAIARAALPNDDWRIMTLRDRHRPEHDAIVGGRLRALFDGHFVDVLPYSQFLSRLAQCRAAIHLDPDYSLGRFAADCAAVGVPCVGYRETMFQGWLFPEISCMYGHEKMIDAWLRELPRSRDYWDQVVAVADARKSQFSPESVRDSFREALLRA